MPRHAPSTPRSQPQGSNVPGFTPMPSGEPQRPATPAPSAPAPFPDPEFDAYVTGRAGRSRYGIPHDDATVGRLVATVQRLREERAAVADVAKDLLQRNVELGTRLDAAEAKREDAEAALETLRGQIGEPKTQHRAVSLQLGTVVKLNADDLRRRDEWIEGTRHEVRTVYRTPWREAEDDDWMATGGVITAEQAAAFARDFALNHGGCVIDATALEWAERVAEEGGEAT